MAQDTHSPAHTQQAKGVIPRLWARLFGSNTARLRERLTPPHWLSYVLIIAQSATVLLVFGHAEIPLLVAHDWGVQVIAALAIFVLVASVFAADVAMLATLKRIPALARNRQRWQLREHVAYTVFVLATEAITLAVVLAALDAAPDRLTAATPLIAPGSSIFTAAIVLRVLLVSWSAVQLVIVRGRLPVLLSTLTATGREIVGAHVERKLAALSLDDISLPAAFRTYAAMSKPPRRVKTLWNGWLVRRDSAAEAEEERQVTSVVDALDELELRSHPALPAPILPAPAMAANPPDRDRPPTGPGTPAAAPVGPNEDETDPDTALHPPLPAPMTPAEDPDEWASRPAASGAAVSDLKAARKMAAEEARRILAFRLLDASPGMSRKSLRTALRCGMNRANELYAAWEYERTRAARSAAR